MLDTVGTEMPELEPEAPRAAVPAGKKSRARSEAPFPYVSLEDALPLADAIRQAGGIPLTRDQLVSRLEGSAHYFSTKLGAALLFGLVARQENKIALTKLGKECLLPDGPDKKAALVEAFLFVDLYKRLVDHFKGTPLPPRDGVEGALVSFGVPESMKERARWPFEKSAVFVGYMNAAKDRLVEPIIAGPAPPDATSTFVKDAIMENPLDGKLPSAAQDDLIKGMLKRLPPTDKPWPMRERAQWLRIFAGNLAMIYPTTEDQEILVALSAPAKPQEEYAPRPRAPAPTPPKPPQVQPKPSAGAPSWDVPESTSAPASGSASDLDDEIPF